MSEPQAMTARPDEDILDDIENLIVHYPPLVNDRHHLQVSVTGGVATLTGYAKTPITRRYLIDGVTLTPGIKSIEASRLYDDESIRMEIARTIPTGVSINVEYGTVVLSGKLPEGKTEEDTVNALRAIPGVQRVVTAFR